MNYFITYLSNDIDLIRIINTDVNLGKFQPVEQSVIFLGTVYTCTYYNYLYLFI